MKKVLPNGSSTQYQYDPAHRIKELTEIDPAGNILDKVEYIYDAAGNKAQITKNCFDEDKETWEKEVTNYQYDLGNRLIKTFGDYPTPEGYSNLAEPIQVEEEGVSYLEYPDRKFKDCHYDNRGNLIQIASGDTVLNQYQFDPRNQLTETVNRHNEQTKYTYDGLGNRVQTRINLDRPGNGRGNGNGNAYGHDKDNTVVPH